MAPSLLREGKKYKSRLLQWHRWAKDLGASDIKALGRCRDIPAWVREESRCGLKILNPQDLPRNGKWLGWRFQRGKFPRDECLFLTGSGTKMLFTVPV